MKEIVNTAEMTNRMVKKKYKFIPKKKNAQIPIESRMIRIETEKRNRKVKG